MICGKKNKRVVAWAGSELLRPPAVEPGPFSQNTGMRRGERRVKLLLMGILGSGGTELGTEKMYAEFWVFLKDVILGRSPQRNSFPDPPRLWGSHAAGPAGAAGEEPGRCSRSWSSSLGWRMKIESPEPCQGWGAGCAPRARALLFWGPWGRLAGWMVPGSLVEMGKKELDGGEKQSWGWACCTLLPPDPSGPPKGAGSAPALGTARTPCAPRGPCPASHPSSGWD